MRETSQRLLIISFVQFQRYRRHGLDVDYVGIQNEPGIAVDYPSMLMSDQQQSYSSFAYSDKSCSSTAFNPKF